MVAEKRGRTRRRLLVVTAMLLAFVLPATGCGGSSSATSQGVTDRQSRQWSPTQEPSGQYTQEPADDDPDAVASGEIWEWTLGRNVWRDPLLARLASSLGKSSKTDINVNSEGYTLQVDSSGTVVAALLYNDETALGFPASSTSFAAYRGRLPAGLSWYDTYDTVLARYGQGQLVNGGWGIEYRFAYQADDGAIIELTYLANHENELPGSPLHIVTRRLASG